MFAFGQVRLVGPLEKLQENAPENHDFTLNYLDNFGKKRLLWSLKRLHTVGMSYSMSVHPTKTPGVWSFSSNCKTSLHLVHRPGRISYKIT